MTKYERLEADKVTAIKNGDKIRKSVLTGMIDDCRKAVIPKKAGEPRKELTDELVDEVLIAYQKMVEEQVETCPQTTQAYKDLYEVYTKSLVIVKEYAPQLIADEAIIRSLVLDALNGEIELSNKNKGQIMKTVMPVLKKNHCDMRIAQKVLQYMIENGQ